MSNTRNRDEFFSETRNNVLKEWPTGQEVDFEEAVNYHKNLPMEKNASYILRKAREEEETLVQSLGSFASFQRLLNFYNEIVENGGADILTLKVDSLTQNKKFQRAKEDYENELSHDRVILDGFPLVIHGISGCRRLIENNKSPIQVRHEGVDVRLIAEIAFAAGLTDFLGGGTCNGIFDPQAISLENNLKYWNYIDNLMGLYAEYGVRINREINIPLTGTLIPPSLQLVMLIMDGLMAASQGVKSLTLCYNQCGNLLQDVAALKETKELFYEYLEKLEIEGFDDIEVNISLFQWPGGFPEDEAKSYSIIALGALVASFAGVTKVIARTPDELATMPAQGAYVNGLKAVKHMLKLTGSQTGLFPYEGLEEEGEVIRNSVRSIIDRILGFEEKDISTKIVKAFEKGVLDLPFSSYGENLGLVMPVRDDKGAVRYFDSGKLPLPEKIKKYNQDQIRKRALNENRDPSFQMVIDDIYAAGKGLIHWDEG